MAVDVRKEGKEYGGMTSVKLVTHPKSDSENQPTTANRPTLLNVKRSLLMSHVVNGTTTKEMAGNTKTDSTIACPTTLRGRYIARSASV
jgi:hypothetical protein